MVQHEKYILLTVTVRMDWCGAGGRWWQEDEVVISIIEIKLNGTREKYHPGTLFSNHPQND